MLDFIIKLFGKKNTIPAGEVAVSPFDKTKYLGKWYEIARLDYRFERNMDNCTAEYSVNKDGSIKVHNRGYNYKKQKWQQADGKALFAKGESIAMLKVSFFGPFYSGYNVIALDEHYQYALVAGETLDYLWILSRTKFIPYDIKNMYLNKAQEIGYDTAKLIWVNHDK